MPVDLCSNRNGLDADDKRACFSFITNNFLYARASSSAASRRRPPSRHRNSLLRSPSTAEEAGKQETRDSGDWGRRFGFYIPRKSFSRGQQQTRDGTGTKFMVPKMADSRGAVVKYFSGGIYTRYSMHPHEFPSPPRVTPFHEPIPTTPILPQYISLPTPFTVCNIKHHLVL